MEKSYSASYAAAGVDITAGYRSVERMKQYVARTMTENCIGGLGGFGGLVSFGLAGGRGHRMQHAPRAAAGDVVQHDVARAQELELLLQRLGGLAGHEQLAGVVAHRPAEVGRLVEIVAHAALDLGLMEVVVVAHIHRRARRWMT